MNLNEVPRSDEEERARGAQAERILNEPLFIEARRSIESQLARVRHDIPTRDTDMMVRAVLMEQLWNQLVQYFEYAVQSGELSNERLKLRDTTVERIGNAIRYGIRNMGVF